MNLTHNTTFTHCGNSKGWYSLLVLIIAFLVSPRTAISQMYVDSLAAHYKPMDDAESFIYASLDLYLKEPSEERLIVFDEFENTVWRSLQNNDEYLAYVILMCNEAFYLTRYSNIYEAIEVYEKAWQLFQQHGLSGFDIIEYCLKPLGNNYSMLGDYRGAEGVVNTYLQFAEKSNSIEHLSGAIINLSIIYHDTGRPDKAIEILNELVARKDVPAEKGGLIYSNLAKNYISLQKLDKAAQAASIAIDRFRKYPQFDTPVQIIQALKILSEVEWRRGNGQTAHLVMEQARQLSESNASVCTVRDLSKLNIVYGNLLTAMGKYKDAIEKYQKALHLLLPDYNPASAQSVPPAKWFYAENAIKEALDGLGNVYEKMDNPRQAIVCYERSFAVEDLLRSTYSYQYSKLIQQVENRNRAERVLTLLADQFNKSNDYAICKEAFQVAERTKALTLKDMMERNRARSFLPTDTLVELEKQLLFKQASILNELAQEQNKSAPNDKIVRNLFARQTQTTLRIKQVQQRLDSLQKSSYASRPGWLNVEAVQEKLARENATLIEYVVGEHSLFQFVVTRDTLIFLKHDYDVTLDHDIREFVNLFSSSTAINNDVEHYKKEALILYRQLLGHYPGQQGDKLVLVPDGILHFLPFDALLYSAVEGINYATFPYAGKRYQITYEPSAFTHTFHSDVAMPLSKQHLLGVFPVFENTNQSLSYSKTEGENIQQQFRHKKFLWKENATKLNFITEASHYAIVHLSTHASSGAQGELPQIQFIDSTLYLPEIYGLNLEADLMVLSACETGIGKLAKGEGVLSLAHGFQSAGVKNIILSLWSVNDQSTAWLLSGFYNHYLQSNSKSNALWQAKIDYLNNKAISNSRKSPYYWAAFVLYGDHSLAPDEPTSGINVFIIAGGVILLWITVVFWYRKSRST